MNDMEIQSTLLHDMYSVVLTSVISTDCFISYASELAINFHPARDISIDYENYSFFLQLSHTLGYYKNKSRYTVNIYIGNLV